MTFAECLALCLGLVVLVLAMLAALLCDELLRQRRTYRALTEAWNREKRKEEER